MSLFPILNTNTYDVYKDNVKNRLIKEKLNSFGKNIGNRFVIKGSKIENKESSPKSLSKRLIKQAIY